MLTFTLIDFSADYFTGTLPTARPLEREFEGRTLGWLEVHGGIGFGTLGSAFRWLIGFNVWSFTSFISRSLS